MCKCVQAKKGEVQTTPEMLQDWKKKRRHSKQKKKKKNEEKSSKECHKDLG